MMFLYYYFLNRDLSYNEFSGPVPATIGDLEHLLELYVADQPHRNHTVFNEKTITYFIWPLLLDA